MPIERDPRQLEIKHLREIVNWNAKRVLEIGCGDGRLSALYSNMTQQIIGIDLNMDVLRLAPQKQLANADFILSDATRMPFPEKTFDIAMFAWSL